MRKHAGTSIVAGVALVMGGFALAPAIFAAAGDSPEITKMLLDVNSQAIQLRADSEEMATFTRSDAGWRSYATQITAIKEHINSAGKVLTSLNAQRGNGSMWQQTAIDRLNPLLKELAGNTETVISALNRNQNRVHTKEFQDYVQANSNMAANLSQVIGDFVDYGNTKTKLEDLAARLEISE